MKLLNELKSNENTIQQSKLGRDVEAEQNRTEVAEEMTVDFSSGKCSDSNGALAHPKRIQTNERTVEVEPTALAVPINQAFGHGQYLNKWPLLHGL